MTRIPIRLVSAIGVAVIGVALVACTGSPGTPASPSASAVASARPSPSVARSAAPASPTASASDGSVPSGSHGPSGSGAPSTTSSDWGVFWDALPGSFPLYPGAHPTVTGGGPASAILDLPADGPTASTWFQNALKAAGFTIEGANGPREDGSFDIVATKGAGDCRTEVSLAPLGTTTTATIYLAAACPFS